MILSTAELSRLRGGVAMADGGFDPLHAGHILYLREVASLGLPVLVNLAPDAWVQRKHPILLDQEDRATVVDSIRWVDYTHISLVATVEVLELLRPRMYVKGSDWRGRLPKEEIRVCEEHGIDVLFLDTVRSSSTAILDRYCEHVRGEPHGRV